MGIIFNSFSYIHALGRTHDRITLACIPIVGGLSLSLSQSPELTISLCSSFLFSGLMFGPDLDIHSKQFNRWGLLKPIWIPYQKILPHRSWLSHGPLIGTVLRLLYLGTWILLIAATITLGLNAIDSTTVLQWPNLQTHAQQFWQDYPNEMVAAFIGLELGAMSHSISDWITSSVASSRR